MEGKTRPIALRALLGVLAIAGLLTACSSSSATPANQGSTTPVASAGCSTPTNVTPGISTTAQPFSNGTESGTYVEEIPTSATGTTPLALVLNLHGYEEPASFQDAGSGLPAYGSAHSFYVVSPQLDQAGLPRWDVSKGSADVTWISNLVSHLEATRCLDLRRIYAAGLSMGAFMVSSLACQLSNQIAAVAPVAGIQAYSWCHPSRPVPVIAFHGTADPFLAFEGGLGAQGAKLPQPSGTGLWSSSLSSQSTQLGANFLKPVPFQTATWAARNGCSSTPTSTKVTSDVHLVAYSACTDDAAVELYVVQGGGHTWPGGPPGVYPAAITGFETQSISANALMWSFFEAHPIRGPLPHS